MYHLSLTDALHYTHSRASCQVLTLKFSTMNKYQFGAPYWSNAEERKAEQRYLSQYQDGRLYINAPPGYMLTRFDNPYRRDDLAQAWAAEPGFTRNSLECKRRLYWLQTERWETGVYHHYRVIVFIKFKSNRDIVRLRLYRLDGKRFGEFFAKGDDFIDLDPEGNPIEIVDALPGALDVDKEAFWRGFDYQHAHGGLSKEQAEAARKKRQQQQRKDTNND